MIFFLFFNKLLLSFYSQPISLIVLLVYFITLVSVWMVIDAIIQPIRDKVFWIFALIIFAPITTAIYALKRRGYLTVTTPVEVQPPSGIPQQSIGAQVIATPVPAPNTVTNQVIRGVGIVLSLILLTGGVMVAGFIVLLFFLFLIGSSGGSEK